MHHHSEVASFWGRLLPIAATATGAAATGPMYRSYLGQKNPYLSLVYAAAIGVASVATVATSAAFDGRRDLSQWRRPGPTFGTYIHKYIWWFNTYPLEFAEFLLVTALTRGVWLHPLGPYMSFYPKFILISYPGFI